jgi:Zn-dependent metalloprotease
MKDRVYGKSSFAIAAALGMFAPCISYAANPILGLSQGWSNPFDTQAESSIERLKTAFESIKNRPEIAQFLNSSDNTLVLDQRVTDGSWETTKFQNYFKGLEVIGSMAFHHQGPLTSDVTDLLARFDLDIHPTLTADQAVAMARSLGTATLKLAQVPTLKILPSDENDSARLVYWVTLQGDATHAGRDVMIDAHDGTVIANMSHWLTLAPVKVYQATDDCQYVDQESGAPMQYDVSQCSLVINNGRASGADASALRARDNSLDVLKYYSTHHSRDSFDNDGTTVSSVVHIGHHFDNAFWDSDAQVMAYGDGDGQEFGDFTRGVDVAGHEMTHGVTSETARLLYYGEYGALNEAFSDFFGKMIANDGDWQMGRQLYLQPGHAGIRDLADPHSITFSYHDANGNRVTKPYPAKMSEKMPSTGMCGDTNDNCYVHINSTIPSHASYLVAQAVGRDKAEKIYYRVLTQLIGPRTNFRTVATAAIKACQQLYPVGSTCAAVQNAYAEVGLATAASTRSSRRSRIGL